VTLVGQREVGDVRKAVLDIALHGYALVVVFVGKSLKCGPVEGIW
jgi:hypothetical protein